MRAVSTSAADGSLCACASDVAESDKPRAKAKAVRRKLLWDLAQARRAQKMSGLDVGGGLGRWTVGGGCGAVAVGGAAVTGGLIDALALGGGCGLL